MTPTVPKYATVFSLLSAWFRCQSIDVPKEGLVAHQRRLLDHDYSLGDGVARLCDIDLVSRLPPAKVIDHHTHVPLYANLMTSNDASTWRDQLIFKRSAKTSAARDISRFGCVEPSLMKRCPTCMQEDVSRYGCAHWRIFHQWPIARHCVVHGDALETRCGHCEAPFLRVVKPRLADDPCPHCKGSRGLANNWAPPSGYWPMLQEMYRLLRAGQAETAQPKPNVALLNETPYSLDVSFERYGVPVEINRLLRDWGVDSFAELAEELGERWPWFYDRTRSAHIRQWPSLVSLAIRLANGMNSASAPRNSFTEVGMQQINMRMQRHEYSANTSPFLLAQTGAFQEPSSAANDFSLHDAA